MPGLATLLDERGISSLYFADHPLRDTVIVEREEGVGAGAAAAGVSEEEDDEGAEGAPSALASLAELLLLLLVEEGLSAEQETTVAMRQRF